MSKGTAEFNDAEALVDAIIQRVGGRIVLALPLGLGKANHIVNAITRRAMSDPGLSLDIITALTLEPPALDADFKRRLLQPAMERLFGNYPPLEYAQLLRDDALPYNIRVSEFFMQAGMWLDVATAQQQYIPANYTHALKFLVDRGVNVIAQLLVEERPQGRLSLSCNPDITVDLLKLRQQGRIDFLLAGQLNSELPYMSGAAEIERGEVDLLLGGKANDFQLFSIPKRPVSMQDQAIGLHVARLVQDGGTLQIGIGSIGDAVVHALLLRHQQPDRFRTHVTGLRLPSATALEQDEPFQEGLYGVSEMFVDGFLHLHEAGILKREVDGAVLHAGFFVGCRDFYRRLRELPRVTRDRFQMQPVSFTNELYGDEALKRKTRVKATFVNNAMMATLRGAVISDALEDGRVVSGVGGQYNFAAQAFALDDARFIITLNATRQHRGKAISNIVWSYGHETLPWHLRDVIVTEYGVADLRGKTESDAIKAMLLIADSRFQEELLESARTAGKIEPDWTIPENYRRNLPDLIDSALQAARKVGDLPPYPFGTDFTAEEQHLLKTLDEIKQRAHSKVALVKLAAAGLAGDPTDLESRCLERMDLEKPTGATEHFQKLLLCAAMRQIRD